MFGFGDKPTKPATTASATGVAPALENTPAPTPVVGEALSAPVPSTLPPQDTQDPKNGPLYIATAAREKKLKDDLNRRALKEEALGGRQLKATTQDMRGYDFINETIHSGNYTNGETIRIYEISLELFGRTKSDSEQKRRDKVVKNMVSALIGAFNERQHGRLTLIPATDPQGCLLGVKVPATPEDRDVYLNKINHVKALATGKVVRAETAFMALPSSSPVRLLNGTITGNVVSVDKQLEE
jgi:hypothetical protein